MWVLYYCCGAGKRVLILDESLPESGSMAPWYMYFPWNAVDSELVGSCGVHACVCVCAVWLAGDQQTDL